MYNPYKYNIRHQFRHPFLKIHDQDLILSFTFSHLHCNDPEKLIPQMYNVTHCKDTKNEILQGI